MAESPRVVTYSRVSTAKHQSTDAQVAELRRYCAARSWNLSLEITDHGFSGGTDNRPGLKDLLYVVRRREVDIVVVSKLDRLARSLRHLITLLDEFSSLGVQFVSIHDQIDLTTSSGRLMLHMIAAFAEFERSLIRERVFAGLQHARSKGKRLGRPPVGDVDAIRALHLTGVSHREIARRLGVSKGKVHRALHGGAPKSPKNPASAMLEKKGKKDG